MQNKSVQIDTIFQTELKKREKTKILYMIWIQTWTLNAGKFKTKKIHWNRKKEAQQKGENRWQDTLALGKKTTQS